MVTVSSCHPSGFLIVYKKYYSILLAMDKILEYIITVEDRFPVWYGILPSIYDPVVKGAPLSLSSSKVQRVFWRDLSDEETDVVYLCF